MNYTDGYFCFYYSYVYNMGSMFKDHMEVGSPLTQHDKSEAQKVVSYIRTHSPDIQPDDNEHVVTSSQKGFKEALSRLDIFFPDNNPVLGFGQGSSLNEIDVWIKTSDPNKLVRISVFKDASEHTPNFFSIHMVGDNIVRNIKSDLDKLADNDKKAMMDVVKNISRNS